MLEVFSDWISCHEGVLRASCFIAIFALLALSESLFPRRIKIEKLPQKTRWISNLSIVAFNNLLMSLLLPLLAIDMAILAQKYNWGIFNRYGVSFWVNIFSHHQVHFLFVRRR